MKKSAKKKTTIKKKGDVVKMKKEKKIQKTKSVVKTKTKKIKAASPIKSVKTPAKVKTSAPAKKKIVEKLKSKKTTQEKVRLIQEKQTKKIRPFKREGKDKQEAIIKARKKKTLLKSNALVSKSLAPAYYEEVQETSARKLRKSPLGIKKLAYMKKLLEEYRDRLEQEVGQLEEISKTTGVGEVNEGLPGYSIHIAEYATDNQVVETSYVQLSYVQRLLSEVTESLERIKQGTFGICLNCKGAVPFSRLEAKPYARYCMDCRKKFETGFI